MRRRLKKKPISFVKKNLILILGCFVLLSISTIGYSALNQALNISGDIAIRAVKDIRITDLELATSSEGGYEYYNSQYNVDSVTISAVLPNVGSSITYEVEITNKGTADMEVSELNAEATTEYFECNIDGLAEGDVIASGETKTFRITISRIANSADNNKNVEVVLGLELKEYIPKPYVDPILAGNDPDLLNNSLVPIMYDETANNGAGSWIVAGEYDAWYDYSNQKWANAVILEDGVTKNVGDPIIVPTADSTETEVKAMYVWIPRYSYTIKSEDGTNYYGKTLSELGASTASKSTPGAIDIKFVDINTNETGIPQYTGDTASNWRTHPAFNWDTNNDGSISASEQLSGIWVGKFEPSAKTTDTCYKSASETNCTSDLVTPYILPNVMSLRYQNVYNQFTTAQKFATYLTNSTNVDAHMMKNSEWGAVAYLSQSIYGKYGNSIYTGTNKEIYKNNSYSSSTGIFTGRSSGLPPASGYSATGTCYYDNITDSGDGTGACGAGASTTGNIYGVYDMSGGAIENVMGYLTTANSNYKTEPENYFGWGSRANNSGFTYKPADKYFDNYTETSSATACNGGICYGHALSETGGWYGDSAYFVNTSSPWFRRGGCYDYTTSAGVFYSGSGYGGAYGNISFRSVFLATSA